MSVLMNTDLPDPVAPTISQCRSRTQSGITTGSGVNRKRCSVGAAVWR